MASYTFYRQFTFLAGLFSKPKLPTMKRGYCGMMVFKRRQVVVLSLILLIIVAGYLQYSYKKSSSAVSDKESGRLGEAVYVDNMDNEPADADDISMNEKTSKKAVSASKQATDFFAQARLDKEVVRSRDTEALKEISEDPGSLNEVKAEAYNCMMMLVNNSEKEANIETLVKERGFEDVIVLVAEDGSVDVVVKAPSLSSAQTAQIADIVTRHAGVDMSKLHITNIY